jgi:GNAT superfamily N-acetyltransferase
MIVRPFEADDSKQILQMGKTFIKESSFSFLPFDPGKMGKILLRSIEYSAEVMCLVVEKDGEIIGSVCACLTEYFFCSEKMTSDYWWYVKPEHRGSRAGIMLLKEYVAWAQAYGAREVMLSTSTGIDMEKTADILERIGFERSGIQLKWRFA